MTEYNTLYPSIDKIISFVDTNKEKGPAKIDLNKLSINGQCVQDDMETYLSTDDISSSNLKKCLDSPFSFLIDCKGQFGEREEKKKSFLKFGTLVHTAIGEPEAFKRALIKPSVDLRKGEDLKKMIRFYNQLREYRYDLTNLPEMKYSQLREFNSKLESECNHFLIEKEDEVILEIIERNYNRYGNGIIKQLLKGALSEVSMYCQEPTHGLRVVICCFSSVFFSFHLVAILLVSSQLLNIGFSSHWIHFPCFASCVCKSCARIFLSRMFWLILRFSFGLRIPIDFMSFLQLISHFKNCEIFAFLC